MIEQLLDDRKFSIDILDTMTEGLMVMNTNGRIVYLNRAAEKITGFSSQEILGEKCTILGNDICLRGEGNTFQRRCRLREKGALRNEKCQMRAKDGRAIYVLRNAKILKNQQGEMLGSLEIITDITSLYMKARELEELREGLRQEYFFMGFIGRSDPILKLYEQIRNAATSEAPVLIYGESGTGKELTAHAVHKLSRRKGGPIIKMNCGALNEQLLESELFGHRKGSFTGATTDRKGRFEAASKGSIFLDEIGDMPQIMQVKLLRALEEKVIERVGDYKPIPVDIRLISATNKDLSELSVTGEFRADLMYRLNSIIIRTPPLREMRDDIPILVGHFLKKISYTNNKFVHRVSSQAMDALINYNWPGNIRHLINALESCAISCKNDAIEIDDLPDYVFQVKKKGSVKKQAEKEKLLQALAKYDGHRIQTAQHLGVSRVTLWKKMKEYEII